MSAEVAPFYFRNLLPHHRESLREARYQSHDGPMRSMSNESHRIPTHACALGPTRDFRTVFKPPNLNEIQAAADNRPACLTASSFFP